MRGQRSFLITSGTVFYVLPCPGRCPTHAAVDVRTVRALHAHISLPEANLSSFAEEKEDNLKSELTAVIQMYSTCGEIIEQETPNYVTALERENG